MTTRQALDTWLDASGLLVDRLTAICYRDDCDRTAGWESFQPGDPDSIRPLCQQHAVDAAQQPKAPIVQLDAA